MNIRAVATAFVVSSLMISSSAIAQQRHIVDTVSMNRAVAAQTATDQQNREVVRGLLHQPQVVALANRLGLDVTKAEAAIATVNGPDLTRMATQARTANAELAGGASVMVISTTTILLVIIIIILLVR